MLKQLNDIIYQFSVSLFPDHIYYNAEKCIWKNGVLERKTRDNEIKEYEIYDIKPDNVKENIELLIKLNNIDKSIMKLILQRLEKKKVHFENLQPEQLLYIENPEMDDKYDDYLKIVKLRKKQLLSIYHQLCNDFFGTKNKISYKWHTNPDKELPELYSLMINKYNLIAPETTYEQFKAVFTGQSIDDSFEPIRWHDENASELLFFINRLVQSSNIAGNPKRADYNKLTACFIKPDGKPFKAVWKSLKTNININLSPDKQRAIDELVSNF